MKIEWTKDLHIGIDEIDAQHKKLVDYINELDSVDEHNNAAVSHVLDEVIEYTVSHFTFEESLQSEAGYIFAVPHKQVHDKFIKHIKEYQKRHNAGEVVAKELHKMLCTWLVRHIQRDDRDYVSEVKENMQKILKDKNEEGWFSRALRKFF